MKKTILYFLVSLVASAAMAQYTIDWFKIAGGGGTSTDHECRNRAQIAAGTPGANATQVDNVWLNIMSYHLPQTIFTSDQLDRATDASNGPRLNVATGRTRFVDRFCFGLGQTGSSQCSAFSGPYPTVAGGVNAANPGDIVMVRLGNDNEPGTYTKAVTFRATRGNATIGIP